jgi:WXG100 family type VII secretion target
VVTTNQVKADLQIMQGTAGKLATDYQQLMDPIGTLQREADTHAATWSGEAKNAWNNAMDNVNRAWNQLNSVLDEITTNIKSSQAQYQDTDTTNAQQLNKVPVTDVSTALGHH